MKPYLPLFILDREDLETWVRLILEIHIEIIKNSQEDPYILLETSSKLESIISSSLNFHKRNKDKAISMYYLIIRDHPFLNANKRTAIALLLFLYKVWHLGTPPAGDVLLENSLRIAKGELSFRDLLSNSF